MNVHKDVKLTFRALLFPKMRFFSVATLGPDSHWVLIHTLLLHSVAITLVFVYTPTIFMLSIFNIIYVLF